MTPSRPLPWELYRIARVWFLKDGSIKIFDWSLSGEDETVYTSSDNLPPWMISKLAVLMLFDPDKINEEIPGVGRRISAAVFWVYFNEGDEIGDDTRTSSEELGT